jgi:hypothetical protein
MIFKIITLTPVRKEEAPGVQRTAKSFDKTNIFLALKMVNSSKKSTY